MKLQLILETVSTTTGIAQELVIGSSRKEEVITARFLFFYLANQHSNADYKKISSFVNRKDKTYYHALKKVQSWIECDKNFRALYETINNQLSLYK